ncbi:methyltransferase domain-containing protein [Nocardia uniformis]|uniref:Methyltransferase domain-containing protein n=1 Tax=Nocardia uniformis TaxID=53432 RepID=A0A849BR34_9NOCA|nr:methyltransferase domain-containing protein [Nocardia uniformis]NNH69073.1 methyltransferase domain-containing protein [Nocardia uniformis]
MTNPLAAPDPWDVVAEGYDDLTAEMMLPFAQIALDSAEPKSDARVLDVAAGPGTLTLPAAARVARVDAVDFSPSMIERLRGHVRDAGLGNVEAQVGDGQRLPFPDNEFDTAFSMFGLMFFPDRAAGFSELFRVLKPGGGAVVSSWAPISESEFMTLMFGAFRAANPDIPQPQANLLSLENPEVFVSELRAAGFHEVTVQPHTVSKAYDSAEALWDRYSRGSAQVHLMRRNCDADTWKRREQLMIDYLNANYRPGQALSTTAWLGSGRK